MPLTEIRGGADFKKATRNTASGGDLSFSITDLLEDRATAVIEKEPLIGQTKPARTPIGEAHSELAFERRKASADGCRGGLQRQGGRRDSLASTIVRKSANSEIESTFPPRRPRRRLRVQ